MHPNNIKDQEVGCWMDRKIHSDTSMSVFFLAASLIDIHFPQWYGVRIVLPTMRALSHRSPLRSLKFILQLKGMVGRCWKHSKSKSSWRVSNGNCHPIFAPIFSAPDLTPLSTPFPHLFTWIGRLEIRQF